MASSGNASSISGVPSLSSSASSPASWHPSASWSVVEFEVQLRSPVAQASRASSTASLSSSVSSPASWQPSESWSVVAFGGPTEIAQRVAGV